MPSAAMPATDAVSPSGNVCAVRGTSAALASISVTGQAAFSASYDPSRRCWVIRQHGTVYSVIVESRKYPAHTQTYVERCVRWLNGDTDGGS